jgi:VIT1/CCC1 family predicted Fe2+/Mn2+ transporter
LFGRTAVRSAEYPCGAVNIFLKSDAKNDLLYIAPIIVFRLRDDAKGRRRMTKRIRIVFYLVGSALIAIPFFFFPDADISILGIKYHRFFLFHSAIVPFVLYFLLAGIRRGLPAKIAALFLSGFALGVSAHLLTDVVPRKAVNFLVAGTLVPGTYADDRLWIIGNMLLGFLLVYLGYRKYSASVSPAEKNKTHSE